MYDPLGWLAPVIIRAKVFMQSLWVMTLQWDDELPTALIDEWMKIRTDGKLQNHHESPLVKVYRRSSTCFTTWIRRCVRTLLRCMYLSSNHSRR